MVPGMGAVFFVYRSTVEFSRLPSQVEARCCAAGVASVHTAPPRPGLKDVSSSVATGTSNPTLGALGWNGSWFSALPI